ncbi:MAG: bacteriohopanetetrol glucosamine biosynthesis glycosyltransferase HpnI [Acidobacteria bacterium]|nr:bacteriohopanetetrol glucosamine biosynthesis glycosyltransferase HpnI [Acidobacteriota bacterium]
MILRILLVVATGGLLTSTIFLLLALVAAARFSRRSARVGLRHFDESPAATMLKPLHGLEPRLRENLESFFLQEYPRFQMIFGARSESDPALRIVRELMRKYPEVDACVVTSGTPPWPNAKLYSLDKMLRRARYEYLVVSDSDVEVGPDYLRNVVAPLLDPSTGCVTCLYRGVPAGGFWALLEALGMSVDMSSGVLIADMLEGMKFALGPTMATRREVLDEIGGFDALRDYCSDDYLLGNWIHERGYHIVLSGEVINHVVLNRNAIASLAHQVRWMRSTRFSRPKGHLGSGLTFAMPFGVLGLIAGAAAHNWTLGLGMLAFAYLNRLVQAIAIGWGVVRDPRSLRYAWLYPLRDITGFVLWIASYLSAEMTWRGERYRLEPGGRMVPVARPTEVPADDRVPV